MNQYVFYTEEGYTASPRGEDVENFQILGFEDGNSAKEALKKLMDRNSWILRTGFNENEILVKRVYD